MDDQSWDQKHAPDYPAETDSTQRATEAAAADSGDQTAPEPQRDDLPTLGERDGEFYLCKVINGSGEIPDSVHKDSYPEVVKTAENNGYLTTGNVRVAEARNQGDRWDVYYAVPVRPNGGQQQADDTRDVQE